MRGIRLNHGVAFVECDGVTVKVSKDGSCELSSVMFPALEWELRTEPPSTYTYLTDGDVDSLGEGVREGIELVVAKLKKTLDE